MKSSPQQKLRSLAFKLGLKCHAVHEIEDYGFDGQGNLYYTAYGWHSADDEVKRVSNLAHDIAHWLIATPERRKLPEFGLGGSPETIGHADAIVNKDDVHAATREEGYASLLGMILERWAGQDPKAFTYDEHSWWDDKIRQDLPELQEKLGNLLISNPDGFYQMTFNESAV